MSVSAVTAAAVAVGVPESLKTSAFAVRCTWRLPETCSPSVAPARSTAPAAGSIPESSTSRVQPCCLARPSSPARRVSPRSRTDGETRAVK